MARMPRMDSNDTVENEVRTVVSSLWSFLLACLLSFPRLYGGRPGSKPPSAAKDFESIKKYALIVGINKYSSKNIPAPEVRRSRRPGALQGCDGPSPGRFPTGISALLTDSSGTPPTAANIGRSLTKITYVGSGERSRARVFFWHGYEEGGRGVPSAGRCRSRRFGLYGHRARRFCPGNRQDLAHRVVVIVDACHAGGISRGGKRWGLTPR